MATRAQLLEKLRAQMVRRGMFDPANPPPGSERYGTLYQRAWEGAGGGNIKPISQVMREQGVRAPSPPTGTLDPGDIPSGYTVLRLSNPERQELFERQMEATCQADAYKCEPTLFKATLTDGSSILVEAPRGDKTAAEQKAIDEGYDVRRITWSPKYEEPKEPTYTIPKLDLSQAAAKEILEAEQKGWEPWVAAVKKHNLAPEDSVAIRVGGDFANTVFVTKDTAELLRKTDWYTSSYRTATGDGYSLEYTWKKLNQVPQVKLGDGTEIPQTSVKDKEGNVLIFGFNDIPQIYQDVAKEKGLTAFAEQMEKDRVAATKELAQAGFSTLGAPGEYGRPYATGEMKAMVEGGLASPTWNFTIPGMAKYVRDNKDGRETLSQFGFSEEVLDKVDQFNTEAEKVIKYIGNNANTFTTAERLAFERALATLGQRVPIDVSATTMAEMREAARASYGKVWEELSKDQKVALAVLFDKDYSKASNFASITKQLQAASAENVVAQFVFGAPVAIMSPIGKQITLEAAKEQLGKDYQTELKVLKPYITPQGTFDIEKLQKATGTDAKLKAELLKDTGYKNMRELTGGLEYYNYGTTVTKKEWAIAGLTAGLFVIPFAHAPLSTVGVWGSLVKHGVPAALGAVMMPDTIRMIKDPGVGIGSKVLAASITAALLSGAVVGIGKFAFKELRQFVKPGTFEADGVSLEVSIPKAQLRSNMTPEMARALVDDLERVWGGKLPKGMADLVSNFQTPAQFQDWYSAIVRNGIMSTQVKTITSQVATQAAVKGRQNPFQAAMGNNVLFSVKPDMATYGGIIGKTKGGLDITPAGSMEWWSPNFSGNVVGGYLGKVKQFYPGGKMLRFSPKDIKAIPNDVFLAVAKKIQKNPKFWEQWKGRTYMKGDRVTAMNYLVAEEMYRRATLPAGSPGALPPGIYPVFKFHWSTWSSGKFRPTWELEMITPAGFKAHTFRPVKYLDKFDTGGKQTPQVASLTVRSPVVGKDLVSGQAVKLGQPMPVIIEATANALKEGKGLPTVRELYMAKYAYRPVAAIQNLFTRRTIARPKATEGYSGVTTPTAWMNKTLEFKPPKINPAEAAAKKTLLRMPENQRYSTSKVAAKVEGKVPDAQGRFSQVRDPYYHPVYEYADNWVVPRTGVMLKHPNIKGGYIVVQDTSRAAQPGVWDIVGGQLDTLGKVRVNRPFGKVTLWEAAQEQLLSELGVGSKFLKPNKIHLGKTTEHSAFGTYMFDGTATSTKFRVPMNKWYDMVKGEWIVEPEVAAIGVLRPGAKGAVTPALYVELARRGFDVRNLLVVDRGLPTSGIKQYVKGTFEYNVLKNAKVYRAGEVGAIGRIKPWDPGGELLWQAQKNMVNRIKPFQDVVSKAPNTDFIVPTSARNPIYTGLVPTMRPPKGYSPAMVVTAAEKAGDLPMRVEADRASLQYVTTPDYRNVPGVEEKDIKWIEEKEPKPVTRAEPRATFTKYKPVPQITTRKVTSVDTKTGKIPKTHLPVTVPPTKPPPTTTTRVPTRVPPAKPPPFARRKIEVGKREKPRRDAPALATWRQGLYWISVYPPYRTTGTKPDVIYSRKRPKQALVTAKGRRSPMKTLRALGKIPPLVEVPMGVTSARILHGRKLVFSRRRTNGRRRRSRR